MSSSATPQISQEGPEPEAESDANTLAQSVAAGHLPVTEFLGEFQGPNAPYGDLELPLTADRIRYEHPEQALPHDA